MTRDHGNNGSSPGKRLALHGSVRHERDNFRWQKMELNGFKGNIWGSEALSIAGGNGFDRKMDSDP